MPNITVAGHICADLTPALPLAIGMLPGQLYDIGRLAIRPGGCVANTGTVLDDLGADVRTAAVVGDDELGAVTVRLLAERGISTDNITVIPGGSTSYSIVIEPEGMNRSFWHHTGVSDRFDGAFIDPAETDLFHIGYPSLLPGLLPNEGEPLRTLLTRFRDSSITTSLDTAVVDRASAIGSLDWHSIFRRTLPLVDVFTPSIDDLSSALELGTVATRDDVTELADRLINDGVAVVMLSAGEDGLLVRTAGRQRFETGGALLAGLGSEWHDAHVWAPARPLKSIATTNGAGDAATAGFLFALSQGASPSRAAQTATEVAARWIQGLRIDPGV